MAGSEALADASAHIVVPASAVERATPPRVDRVQQVGELARCHCTRVALAACFVAVAQRPLPAPCEPRQVRVREILAVAARAPQQRAKICGPISTAPVTRLSCSSED